VLCGIYVASSNKTYFDLHVKCPKRLSDFNQICCFSKDFHTNVVCQISRKSVEWETEQIRTDRRKDGRTDGNEEAIRRSSCL